MKKKFLSLLLCSIVIYVVKAAPQLPGNCEASLPQLLLKPTIKDTDTRALVSSGNWGQKSK